jgi:integrase
MGLVPIQNRQVSIRRENQKQTGLRRGELGSLIASSFRLDAKPPTVTVEAAYSKHRRKDVQVLHPSVATQVKEWLAVESDDELLFPISKATCF